MSVTLFVFGLLSVGVGVGLLLGAKYLLPRLDVSESSLTSLGLLTAMLAGAMITFGLIAVALGALAL